MSTYAKIIVLYMIMYIIWQQLFLFYFSALNKKQVKLK